jgi:hypothetical protein
VVKLEFSLPGVPAPVPLKGHVAYTRARSDVVRGGVGIEFIDVESTLRAQMVELVESVDALTPLAG